MSITLARNLKIKKKDGLNFSKLSGDNNPIHINEVAGQVSQFGENIVHGCLILLRILKKVKIDNFQLIKISFRDFIKYNKNYKIVLQKKSKHKNIYKIYQEDELKISLNIFFKTKNEIKTFKEKTYEKKIKISKAKKNKYNDSKIDPNLKLALCQLSQFVGVEYPGKYSLINEINIYKKKSFLEKNLINIRSNKLDKRFNLIENYLEYKKYFINFKTSIRPQLKIKLEKPSKNILKEINKIKNNILIIGGSNGIGNDLMKLFLNNKKIKVISTFYKSEIKLKNKNLISTKIDITKNIKVLQRIIKKYSPLNIYYFATPIINTRINSKIRNKLYSEFYIKIPIKLVKVSLKYNNNFFYPSTSFINEKNNSNYSLSKMIFEKKIKHLSKRKNKINVLRIPRVNTKHNLSLLNEKLPNFREILFKDKEIRKSVFFL